MNVTNEEEREKALYLLGSQLNIACEMANTISQEELLDYFITLKKEFLTTFGTLDDIPADNVSDTSSSYEIPDATSTAPHLLIDSNSDQEEEESTAI